MNNLRNLNNINACKLNNDYYPLTSSKNNISNNDTVFSKMKEELPSFVYNCKSIGRTGLNIFSEISGTMADSDKLRRKVENVKKKYSFVSELEKNKNVFIYGEEKGKFINNAKLINDSSSLSKITSNLVYNAKGVFSKNFGLNLNKIGNILVKQKHSKVENILDSMSNIRRNVFASRNIIK